MRLLCASACLFMALAAVQQAAAASCPSTTCQADFNTQGGYVDCCQWDYNKGDCWWGSTPVSFKLTRTCTEGSTTYKVLNKRNFQGPPGGEPECRCKDGASGGQQQKPSVLQACIFLKPRVEMDISGNDIPCKSNSFCQICGSPEEVKTACMQDNRCVAFSYEASTRCGYLKAAPFFTTRKGWVAYTRD